MIAALRSNFTIAYTEAIYGDWGGAPLRDIIKGLKHVYKEYPEIDPQRSYAVGLSYGGYMVNLLQGHAHALGVDFAALACMDGVFNTEYLTYTIDIPFFVCPSFDANVDDLCLCCCFGVDATRLAWLALGE